MGVNSKIEWTNHTFNPWMGCVKVSPACKFCYAEADRKMRGQLLWGAAAPRQVTSEAYWKQPLKWDRDARQSGVRARVFCGSLCDVMEDYGGRMMCSWADQWTMHDVRDCALYPLIERTPTLDWLLLTKRPENYRRFLPESWLGSPRPNVWLGTTVESSEYFWRIDALKTAPAGVHFLSIEPLLSDIPALGEYLDGIEWVICGGESGHHARPMHSDWARGVRDTCESRGISFLFKQWGEHDSGLVKIGKKAAGRIIDGRTWDQLPLQAGHS